MQDLSWKAHQHDILPSILESTSNYLNYNLKRLRLLKNMEYFLKLFKPLEGKYKAIGSKTLNLG